MKRFLFVFAAVSLLAMSGCNKAEKSASEDTAATDTAAASNNEADTGGVIQLTTDGFLEKVVNYRDQNDKMWNYLGDKPAIVDFYADWCRPCRMMAPFLEEAAEKYAGQVYIYKVNVDKETEVATSFGIQGIPTLMFIPVGRDPEVIVGAIGKEALFSKIEDILK